MKHIKRVLAVVLVAVIAFTASRCYHRFQERGFDLLGMFLDWADRTKCSLRNFVDSAQDTIAGWPGITGGEVEWQAETALPGFSADANRFETDALAETDRYQYNALSQSEKEMYRAVVAGIRKGETVVKTVDYQVDTGALFHVYRAVVTDHPEFFFLAKSFLYTIMPSGKAGKLILLYSDGETSDQYDKKGELTASADRKTIERQITLFSERIARLRAKVRTETDLWGIEKQLHDLVIDEVAYDEEAESKLETAEADKTHAFDAYGAACEGKAVCEGYTKLFQYLCGCYGINCTTVSGTSDGAGHMWNAVQLNGNWTMVDVTWNDAEKDDLRYYRYFNRTEKEMRNDHEVTEVTLAVPECTSEEGAFFRRFAFDADTKDEAPGNYKEVLDRLAAGEDRFVCLKVSGSENEISRYINEQIFDSRSKVQRYIKSAGYGIRFSEKTYATDSYYYLMLD